MRPSNRDLRMGIVAIVLGLAAIVCNRVSAAETFVLQKPSCYFDNIDYRYKLVDGPDAIVWWCETSSGLEENYRVGEIGGLREFLFRIGGAGKDLYAADRQIFIRAANDTEQRLVESIEAAGEPRCVFTSTAKTTGVLDAARIARKDDSGVAIKVSTSQRPSCYVWQVVGSKHYCAVMGIDTKGRDLPAESFVPCKVVLAPEAGWSAGG